MFVKIVGLSSRIPNIIPDLKEYIKTNPERIKWKLDVNETREYVLNLDAKTEETHRLDFHPFIANDQIALYGIIQSNFAAKKILFIFDGDTDLQKQFDILDQIKYFSPFGWYFVLITPVNQSKINILREQIDKYFETRKNVVPGHKEFVIENRVTLIDSPKDHVQNMEKWMRFIDTLPYIEKKKVPRKKNTPILLIKDISIEDLKKKKFWRIQDFNDENLVESEIAERKKVLNKDVILHGGVLVLRENRVYPILVSKYYEDGGEVGDEFIYFDNQWKLFNNKIPLNGEFEGKYLSYISTLDIHEYQEGNFESKKNGKNCS